ncbi:MAG: glycoside hydrolase family 2, partial [Clostridiales bacterium]|nr:glycoside hydrolase family 2 [Clostridiales bacterium]
MECYIKNYPRPQFVRKEWEDLNGGWAFAFDGGDSGERECWFKSFPSGMKINVPFTYETVLSGINDETPREIVWYERDLPTRPEAGKRAALHFEGSDYETKVWVNGIFIGIHTGGYARFSFDITGALAEVGANKLTVRVRDAKDIRQPRGKQRWTDYSFGCWYTQT